MDVSFGPGLAFRVFLDPVFVAIQVITLMVVLVAWKFGYGLHSWRAKKREILARRRSQQLLEAHLSPEQLKDWKRAGAFTAIGNDTRRHYLITQGIVHGHRGSYC